MSKTRFIDGKKLILVQCSNMTKGKGLSIHERSES